MKIKYILLGVLLCVQLDAKVETLKIDDIVEMSLKHSPDIEIQRLDFKGAKERTKFAKGGYLPRVDMSLATGQQYSKLKNQSSTNMDVLRGGLGASVLLYDFGKTAGKVQSSRQESLALEAQMQQSISDKIFLLKQIYYDILKTKSIINVQKKNVKLQKQQLYRAEKYLASGIKTIIDVSDSKVRVEQAKLELKNAKYSLELKRATLEEEIGFVPYKGKYVLYSQTLPDTGLSVSLPAMKTSLSKLEQYAYKHRYLLSASRHYVHRAKSKVKGARGEYYPTLSLSGNYEAQEVDNTLLALTPEHQGEITINMSWNIFSGYQSDATMEEAKLGVLKASSQVQDIRLAVKREVLESHILLRQSKDNVFLSESISHVSYQKFEQAEKRYANELSDYIELQDAQQGYISSLSDLVNAYYDYFIAMAKLDHAIGK